MSPRDLPVWARAATAVLLIVAGWYAAHADAMVAMVGGSVLEVSAGVVGVVILLSMRLPLEMWPRHPARDRFSLGAAIATSGGFGLLLVASGPVGAVETLTREEPGAVFAIVVGGAMWALAFGSVRVETYARWMGLAAIFGAAPGLAVLIVSLASGTPVGSWLAFFQVAAFFVVLGSTAGLVTQELAFRRALLGQAGDAGLAAVLVASVVFGLWHAVGSEGVSGVPLAITSGLLHGAVSGCLYVLTRSLLIPAVYHGVWSGVWRALEVSGPGEPMTDRYVLMAAAITAGIAVWLAVQVNRRAGFWGVLRGPRRLHAADR